jgi:hypothetical protein
MQCFVHSLVNRKERMTSLPFDFCLRIARDSDSYTILRCEVYFSFRQFRCLLTFFFRRLMITAISITRPIRINTYTTSVSRVDRSDPNAVILRERKHIVS